MGRFDHATITELRNQTESLMFTVSQLNSLQIMINGYGVNFSSVVQALELINERLSRIEQTGIIERLQKAEVMK